MIDVNVIKKEFEKNDKFELKEIEVRKDDSIQFKFVEKGKKFIYNFSINKIYDDIFFSFSRIYKKESFDDKKRIVLSELVQILKNIIIKYDKDRIKIMLGNVRLNNNWLIIDDLDSYKKRVKENNYEEHKNKIMEILNFKEEDTSEKEEFEYKFYLAGEDSEKLINLLNNTDVIKVIKKRKVDYQIIFEKENTKKSIEKIEKVKKYLEEKKYQVFLYIKN